MRQFVSVYICGGRLGALGYGGPRAPVPCPLCRGRGTSAVHPCQSRCHSVASRPLSRGAAASRGGLSSLPGGDSHFPWASFLPHKRATVIFGAPPSSPFGSPRNTQPSSFLPPAFPHGTLKKGEEGGPTLNFLAAALAVPFLCIRQNEHARECDKEGKRGQVEESELKSSGGDEDGQIDGERTPSVPLDSESSNEGSLESGEGEKVEANGNETSNHTRPFLDAPPPSPSLLYSSDNLWKRARTAAAVAGLVGIDVGLRAVFAKCRWSFPSNLAGMLGLSGLLMGGEVLVPGFSRSILEFLRPGSEYLSFWMPLFFVTGLVTLPLDPPKNLPRLLGFLSAAFVFSLLSTAAVVSALSSAWGTRVERRERADSLALKTDGGLAPPPPCASSSDRLAKESGLCTAGGRDQSNENEKGSRGGEALLEGDGIPEQSGGRSHFSSEFVRLVAGLCGISFLLAAGMTRSLGFIAAGSKGGGGGGGGAGGGWTLLRSKAGTASASAFLFLSTLLGYLIGCETPEAIAAVAHPLLFSASAAVGGAWVLAKIAQARGASSVDWGGLLRLFVAPLPHAPGATAPLSQFLRWACAPAVLSAGSFLQFMLSPSVIGLSVGLFDRREKVFESAGPLLIGCLVASAIGVVGTAVLGASGLFGKLPPSVLLAAVPRSITAPLAVEVARLLRTDRGLTLAFVVLTGIMGANFGRRMLDGIGVSDPCVRGVAIGAASHGLGTAAMIEEKEAFAFSALALALTGTFSVVLVSVLPLRRLLFRLSGSGPKGPAGP
uniref:Uncharacterized protein n=1 Tax=Chromera velia CCMP2878 TaxID=1169474 RepID=A0A0G4FYW4_9ALVE|eukprot:Cvel_3913.t1-p1 / transcript=Cvel_3913.t1 / gene=Cvel_3913 / organism=Chromera_velia_CCMP2878 / gene_product=Plastidal glycolate/glycerate translocator 1,, putative / transcript_product=Plastidal glycolate/glycerate translocator 1,, putative / location=Cvel_scaffold166:18801-24488(-) / protein_length=774 / sequence_SO=supercontig / SO=protein_coding / is_pseudo=false